MFLLFMSKNRRDFLKNACAPILFGALGIPLINSCSKESSSVATLPSTPSEPFSIELNINEGELSVLKEVGGWLNYSEKNLLLVRVSDNLIRAFDNACPHQGARNQWSFTNNEFKCNNHGRVFKATCSSSLRCYTAKIDGDIITIQKVFPTLNQVEIIGQVKNPGIYYFNSGMRLKDLIDLSGGLSDTTFWKSVFELLILDLLLLAI